MMEVVKKSGYGEKKKPEPYLDTIPLNGTALD